MPRLDSDRLEVAEEVLTQLAVEQTLSSVQARSFVRCLQTAWNVDTIAWRDRESEGQLTDAMRLVHAAGIYREIEGTSSDCAQRCYRRAGEVLEWLFRANDDVKELVPIGLLSAAAYQLGGLPAMAFGLLAQTQDSDTGTKLIGCFLKADFNGVLNSISKFWGQNEELITRSGSKILYDEDKGLDLSWLVTVELVRTLGLFADSLRRGRHDRAAQAIEVMKSLDPLHNWNK